MKVYSDFNLSFYFKYNKLNYFFLYHVIILTHSIAVHVV